MTDLEGSYGPKMTALTERQRRFVEAWFLRPHATEAARTAGYSDTSRASLAVQGHRLLHDARIQAAMHEYLEKVFKAEATASMLTLVEIRDNPTEAGATRLKASVEVLNRSGFHGVTEQRHSLALGDDPDQLKRIAQMALAAGLDPATLLGHRLAPMIDVTPIVPEIEDKTFEDWNF